MYPMYCPSQIRSSGGTISVDTIDCYMHQLQQYKAIATCDDLLRLFVVQDFSTETLSLKVTHTLNVFNLSLTLYYPFSVSTVLCHDQYGNLLMELSGYMYAHVTPMLQN